MKRLLDCFRNKVLILCSVCIGTVGCGSLKPIENPLNIVEVGRPLVIDGSRLIQEFSERRLEIDNAIKNAKITDIDTVARITDRTRLELGLQAGRNTDEAAIDTLRSAQSTSQQENVNRIALQNQQLTYTAERFRLANEQSQQQIENNIQQTELNNIRLQNYRSQIEYYTGVLESTPNSTDENKVIRADAVTQLTAIRTEMAAITIGSTPVTPPGELSPVNPSNEVLTTDLVPDAKFVDNSAISGDPSAFSKISEALAGVGVLPSTRQEQFQQYQSYIDELYATKNQYALDDSHLRQGRRIVRLVMPVYVPPANTDDIRTVRVTISNIEEKSGSSRNNTHTRALLKATNQLTRMRNDNDVLYTTFKEKEELIKSQSLFAESSSIDPVCNSKVMICSCMDIKGKSKFNGDYSVDYDNDVVSTSTKLSYGKLVHRCWKAVRTALEIGFSEVNQCMKFSPSNNVWILETGGICNHREHDESSYANIYSVRPLVDREKIERESSRVFGLALALGETFGGTTSSEVGSIAASARYAREQLAQAASRVPVVSAYRGNQKDDSNVEFGWHIYPRISLNKNGNPVRLQTGTQFNGITDLSVPDWWRKATVKVYVNKSRNPKAEFDISIPKLTMLEAARHILSIPIVSDFKEYGLVDGTKQISIPISGVNLWRSPDVLVGGRRANRVQYVSDNPNHLVATFDNLVGISCDYNRENFNKTELDYWNETIDPNKHCASKIMLHTSDGRAFVGSVVTSKANQPKQQTPKPTAKFQSATLKDDSLTILMQDLAESVYTDGTAATLTEIIGGSAGENIDVVTGESSPLEENKKLKKITFTGTKLNNFCKSETKAAAECFVQLRIGKDLKYSGPITIRRIE